MARTVDITEKLNFEDNPQLIVKGEKYEVNADALSMLRVMQCMQTDQPSAEDLIGAYETMFSEKERKRMEKNLKLKLDDFTTVIKEAAGLVLGDNETGE